MHGSGLRSPALIKVKDHKNICQGPGSPDDLSRIPSFLKVKGHELCDERKINEGVQ